MPSPGMRSRSQLAALLLTGNQCSRQMFRFGQKLHYKGTMQLEHGKSNLVVCYCWLLTEVLIVALGRENTVHEALALENAFVKSTDDSQLLVVGVEDEINRTLRFHSADTQIWVAKINKQIDKLQHSRSAVKPRAVLSAERVGSPRGAGDTFLVRLGLDETLTSKSSTVMKVVLKDFMELGLDRLIDEIEQCAREQLGLENLEVCHLTVSCSPPGPHTCKLERDRRITLASKQFEKDTIIKARCADNWALRPGNTEQSIRKRRFEAFVAMPVEERAAMLVGMSLEDKVTMFEAMSYRRLRRRF